MCRCSSTPSPTLFTVSSASTSRAGLLAAARRRSHDVLCSSTKVACGPWSGRSAWAGGSLELRAAGRQVPRVRCSHLLALAEVLDEAQPSEPVHELGDLALVDDTRAFSDLAVARPRMLRDDHENLHRPVGEADVQTFKGIFAARRSAWAPGRWDIGCRPALFAARDPRSEIRQHDHAHQWTE